MPQQYLMMIILCPKKIPQPRGEQRFVGTGMDAQGRILTVVYTLEHEEAIRLISTRRATRREANYYAQYRRH